MASPSTDVTSPPPIATLNDKKEENVNSDIQNRSRSNHHLEPNPFEQSFSQPPQATSAFSPPSPRPKPRSSSSNKDDDSSPSKPTLPPIAAMASPTPNDFNWADLQGSLRSGPLSPAMLAGPQQSSYSSGHHSSSLSHLTSAFDPSNMRTGLTPDVTRTGLTPLVGGPTSFPPPSPNTAAFIAMVTSASNNAGVPAQAPQTITPGTFSSITGMVNSMNGGSNGGHQPHPLSVSHLPDHRDKGFAPTTTAAPFNSQSDAHTAANGLFLLSQAHQELAKREEQQAQQAQLNQDRSSPPQNNNTASTTANTTSGRRTTARSTAGTKRKVTEEQVVTRTAPAAKKARGGAAATSARSGGGGGAGASGNGGGRRGGASRKKSEDMTDDSDNDDVVDSDDDTATSPTAVDRDEGRQAAPKKPETEEEKRRNFLERNRQAALKCRQRKKAWLAQLQQKVEFLSTENERLQNMTVSMREEISRLSAVVVAHRDCGLGGVSVARSEELIAGNAHVKSTEHVPSNAPIARGGSIGIPHGGNIMNGGVSNGGSGNGNGNGGRSGRGVTTSPVSAPPNAAQMVQPVGGSSKGRGGYGY